MKRLSKKLLFLLVFVFLLSFSSNTLYAYNIPKKINYLAVFIEFSDSDNNLHHLDDEESVNNADIIFNSDQPFEMNTVNGVIEVPSFKKYYEMQSYGKLSITTSIFPKQDGKVSSYRDKHPIGYYLKYSESNPIGYKDSDESLQRETELINNAVAYVANEIALVFNESDIDVENDSIVDAISFFVEGYDVFNANIGWGDLLWSHKSDNLGITSTILGKSVYSYNLLYAYDYTDVAGLFSFNRGTYGTIIHEFGHTLGYMDLYRFDHESNSNPVGFYDVMGNASASNPQNFLTYFTSDYSSNKWHNSIPIIDKTTKNITLHKPEFSDDGEMRAIKICGTDDEYFIVEYHEKQNTYSNYSADASGLIVYRVNEKNKYLGNKDGGYKGDGDHIFVFRPNETDLGAGLGNLSEATLNMKRPIIGKKDSGNLFDNQTIYYADGANSGIVIEVVSETSSSITFNVYLKEILGSGLIEDPYLISDTDTFLYLLQLDTKNKYYKLVNDLDFANIEYPKIDFSGKLDGNYKTLSNIKTKGTGVFDTLGIDGNKAEVKNLNIENINVAPENGNHLGGFVSSSINAILDNIHLKSGKVSNINSEFNSISSTGGFAGYVSSNTTIINCSSSILVQAVNNVGGFIGINMNAIMENIYVDGRVNGESNVGAFIGLQYILDDNYNIPKKSYYNAETKLKIVGGYVENYHNSSALDVSNLDIGLTGISSLPILNIKKGDIVSYELITNPKTTLTYSVISDNTNIASYENGYIKGENAGIVKVFAKLKIGMRTIDFLTEVIVEDKDINDEEKDQFINEEDVLKYFGLIKKDDYVYGFALETNVDYIIKILSSYEGVNLKSFKDRNGEKIVNGIVATGMTFTLSFNNSEYNYTIVIKGDVNGDGYIYATDYVKIRNYIMGKTNLSGAYLMAGDVDNDGYVYATDYVKIRNYIMGKGSI